MAALVRRTWANMKTEVILRLGRENDAALTAGASRVEYWIDSAYRQIAQLYHHHELHATGAGTLSTSSNEVTLPADLYILLGFRIEDPGTGDPIGGLTPEWPSFLVGAYDATSARPTKYARSGSKLYLDSLPDLAYPYTVLYYKRPADPDFASGSPPLDRMFDEMIVEGAVAMGQRGFWRHEFSQVGMQTLQGFLERSVHPSLREQPIPETKLAPTAIRPHTGGPQG